MTKKEDIQEFVKERERLNNIIKNRDNITVKRFLNLDTNVYKEGVLPAKTKELMGLIASLVLRCDDCINYHLMQCHKHQVSTHELEETVAVALIVGGSITIPHIRRLFDNWQKVIANSEEK